MEKSLIYGGLLLGAIIVSVVYGAYRAYEKIRENERLADEKREEEIQKRVDAAAHINEERVAQLQQIAEGWKEMAQVKTARITELQEKLEVVTKDLHALESKYERLTELYTESQAALSTLQKQLNSLTSGK